MALRYSDYKKVSFTASDGSYEIGTIGGTKFVSVSTLLLATQDCWVKFNDDSFFQFVHKDDYMDFDRKLYKITYKQDALGGDLEIWAEGNQSR